MPDKKKSPTSIQDGVGRSSYPQFYIDKHYNDMNRRERREYKRWLEKNNMWDGAIVIENQIKEKRLSYRE